MSRTNTYGSGAWVSAGRLRDRRAPARDRAGRHAPIDPAALAAELEAAISGEVRFDAGSRALYASDLSAYRQVPIGVVIPKNEADVIAAVEICRRHHAPILGRGCGTSLAGQACNVAVVIDFSKYMDRILALDVDDRSAWVEPGVICDQLRDAAEQHGLTFAPDPATHAYCTLGGMIGNNACGAHSVMGGKTVDNVEELEILTYDGERMRVGAVSDDELARIIAEGGRRGEIYDRLRQLRDRHADEIRRRFVDIPRRVSGYNLDDLLPEKGFHVARALVGSEGTCVIVLRAKVRLVPSPAHRALVVVGYRDVFEAGDHASEMSAHAPLAIEGFHDRLVRNLERRGKRPPGADLLPEGGAWLLVELGGGTAEEARQRARDAAARIEQLGGHTAIRVFEDADEQASVWAVRESGVGGSRVSREEGGWPGWEDGAVPPERLGKYLRDLVKLLGEYEYPHTMYGHFGQGCVHVRIGFDFTTQAGVARYREFQERAADLVVSYGGSLSGEHGDGQARGELLPRMFGEALVGAFREFKAAWDPDGRMNPGKGVDANPLDRDLRVGPDYHPARHDTHFHFPEDRGGFAEATERCFGVGKCRKVDQGTMCPSFMVTREEKHTTRGRTRLLFEMLRGEVVTGGWRDPHVKESLDLCLSCKGCKDECPVSVDVATYKAEFLSHYYEGRRRPLLDHALGHVARWARLASRAPRLANVFTQSPLLARLGKAVLGIAPDRPLPALASQTFVDWFRSRAPRREGGEPVMLWPDTFNNYFSPHTARAAVEVLEDAGFHPQIPQQALCCGRPLFDFGMLDDAKRYLRRVLDALRPALEAGIPVVGLEPSCVAVFRDELTNLFPDDLDARRLRDQTFLLGELLQRRGELDLPRLEGTAIVQAHCHQKAIGASGPDEDLLRRAGLEVEVLDAGCCGMAGAFGYERDKYEVSMAVGERVLLPAVRRASKETLVIADGFSCRTQIENATDRRALHVAEVLQRGRQSARADRSYPEHGYVQETPPPSLRDQAVVAALAVGAAALVGLGGWGVVRLVRGR